MAALRAHAYALGERIDLRGLLHAWLLDEYEIKERPVALERKLGLLSKTAQTLLNLLQSSRSLRVEWYIVLLIVLEVVLMLYYEWR